MRKFWERFDGLWLVVVLVVSALAAIMMIAIVQYLRATECRERGGLPVRGQWSSIECAQKAGGRNE